MKNFTLKIAFVGNPIRPDITFDQSALTYLGERGFNAVQLNIAWGCRPGDEPLNLEDLFSPDGNDDDRQRHWAAEMARRAALAKSMGFRVLFHFGAPKMDSLYKMIASEAETDRQTCLNSVQRPEVAEKYRKLLHRLAERIPEVDDILMYTFDQEAWLGNEFGNDPLAAGVPLAGRVAPFLREMTACWGELRPEGRLWWEPWEISAGIIYDTLPALPTEHFGMMLHANIAEVQMTNPVDRWFRNMALLCAERGIPVCGETFLSGANEEVEPLQHAFAPGLIWEEIHRLGELSIFGIKEYYGTRPDMADDLNLAMADLCFAYPDDTEEQSLARLAAQYPNAVSLLEAMHQAQKGLALFPWDLSWRWREICKQHTAWHPYTKWLQFGSVAPSPSWCSTRRAIFMLTDDEREHNPWLIEDIGLRCKAAAGAMQKAAEAYRRAARESGCAAFDEAGQEFGRFAAVALDEWLHAEETLCAGHIRRLQQDGRVPEALEARMRRAMELDIENQKHTEAAPDAVSEAPAQLAAFLADPVGYCRTHFC